MHLRKAKNTDVHAMRALINDMAARTDSDYKHGHMLPRSLTELYEHIRDYTVLVNEDDKVMGCCALQSTWDGLAELKALAVNDSLQGQGWGRKLVVVGACIGTDAHTVGIDAILNIKGFAGEKGLEYYRELRVVNLGAQVPVPDLVRRARAEAADAVLVSQVVTQRDAHLINTREMSAAFRKAMGPRRPVLVVGGPRFDVSAAPELGVDQVFGRGTKPGEVASYLVHALSRRAVRSTQVPAGASA